MNVLYTAEATSRGGRENGRAVSLGRGPRRRGRPAQGLRRQRHEDQSRAALRRRLRGLLRERDHLHGAQQEDRSPRLRCHGAGGHWADGSRRLRPGGRAAGQPAGPGSTTGGGAGRGGAQDMPVLERDPRERRSQAYGRGAAAGLGAQAGKVATSSASRRSRLQSEMLGHCLCHEHSVEGVVVVARKAVSDDIASGSSRSSCSQANESTCSRRSPGVFNLPIDVL